MSAKATLSLQAKHLNEIVNPLLQWYDQYARVLPWRSESTPYRIWISEIMLQQTRVEAVKAYYERFLNVLPDVKSLASAPEEQLMKLWEGLGYYNRARNLQRAAKMIVAEYDGEIPASYEGLLKLPGFGAYTAGAVSSIAFGIPVPAVDGNVLRVISRILASREDVTKPDVKNAITEAVAKILPNERVGDFNQSLMELGAMICLPNGLPKCSECPVADFCKGCQQKIAAEIPVKTPKKARKAEDRTVFLLINENRVALQRRPANGLLAGLWEFPNIIGKLTVEETRDLLRAWGIEPVKIQTLKKAKHIFTHIEWHMNGYMVTGDFDHSIDFTWAGRNQLTEELIVPTAFQAYYQQALQVLL